MCEQKVGYIRVHRGADVGSDHHLLVGKIRIKLKRKTKKEQEIRSMKRASAQCVAIRMPKQVVMYTEVGIYNNANSPNGFLTTAVV